MSSTLSKDIVFTYFSGNASALQKKLLQEWLLEPSNAELYYEWLEEWETAQPQFLPDVPVAYQKMEERIDEQPECKVVAVRAPMRNYQPFWWGAALVLFTLGIYLKRDAVFYQTYRTGYGQLQTVVLEDGSKVVLNANSSVRLPRLAWGSSEREIFLTGEAEFSVRHTIDNKRFVVYTPDQSKVTVLGTEFVVNTRKGTKVVLNKGKVELTSATDKKPLTMKPGDRATITTNGQIQVQQLTENQLLAQSAWKEHRFVCDKTPLKEVAEKIHETFGVSVFIRDKELAMSSVSGSFNAQNADELLKTLSEMLDFEVIKSEKKTVVLSPRL